MTEEENEKVVENFVRLGLLYQEEHLPVNDCELGNEDDESEEEEEEEEMSDDDGWDEEQDLIDQERWERQLFHVEVLSDSDTDSGYDTT